MYNVVPTLGHCACIYVTMTISISTAVPVYFFPYSFSLLSFSFPSILLTLLSSDPVGATARRFAVNLPTCIASERYRAGICFNPGATYFFARHLLVIRIILNFYILLPYLRFFVMCRLSQASFTLITVLIFCTGLHVSDGFSLFNGE